MKLSFREKYSYGIGAFGKDLVYAFVATYLMMFFTDEVGYHLYLWEDYFLYRDFGMLLMTQ